MSYILEALKKAQAERQLGNSPTIHAPTLHVADPAAAGARIKKPLLLALLAMAAVIVVLLVMVLRKAPAVEPVNVPAAAPAVAQTAPIADVVAAPVPVAAPTPAAPTHAEPEPLPPPVATVTVPAKPLPVDAATVAAAAPARATAPALAAQASGSPAGAPAINIATAPQEPVMNLRDLPEPIQRSVPQVTIGGNMYSKNPADRLLIVDKILRHEGEEVAPGLILERLQPKEAIFSFKGYRYRVPY